MSTKITALPAAATVALTDIVPIVELATTTTKKATWTTVRSALFPASISADVSGLGTGIATFLGTPSGANLATALTSALPVSKGGTGVASLTVPASGLLVGTTDTQTLSGKVISDASNTLSVGIATSVTGLAAGVSSFLTVPTSANLLAALTDETGSGACVFGTAPLFKTTINLNNPANTFKYVLTPAAIAADRILNLPLLAATDTVAVLAMAQTLTNKTLVAASNTITDTSAALGDILKHDGTRFVRLARGSANQVLTVNSGGTDVAWAASAGGGGSPGGSTTQVQFNDASAFAGDAGMTYDKTNDVLSLAGAVATGTTPAAAGSVRMSSVSQVTFRNNANDDDIHGISKDAGDELYIGSDSAFTSTKTALYMDLTSRLGTYFRISGTTMQLMDASFIRTANPTIGYGTPYGTHGAVTYAFASNANYTLTAAEYVYDWISFNVGAITAGRTVTFPSVASLDAAYTKTVFNNTGFTLTISNGGTTKTLVTGLAQRFLFGVSAVSFASPTWTP